MTDSRTRTAMCPERLTRLTAGLRRYVDDGSLPGVVAMVRRRGEPAHVDVIGHADLATQAPMRRDTLFRIASMTKPITSAAALMLVEEGRMRLDDPIGRWLPELARPKVLTNPLAGLDEVEEARRPILVRDLLLHRSGLAYPITAGGALSDALRDIGGDVLPGLAPDEWLDRLGRLPLLFQPGERWHYGYSTDVLGILIARVSGSSFPDFLAERIFRPLAMNDTGFSVGPDAVDRLATAYVRLPDSGELCVYDPPQGRWAAPVAFPSGGAGLVSTADDYMAFAQMLLDGGAANGARLLSRRSVGLMASDLLTAEERATPFMNIDGFWSAKGFGLGLSTIVDAGRHAALGSVGQFGWPGAFGTFWLADPQEELAAVLMFQDYWSQSPIQIDFQNLIYQALED